MADVRGDFLGPPHETMPATSETRIPKELGKL